MKTLALAFTLIASPALAQDFTVKRGETIRIFSWSFFGDTCKATSYPEIRAVKDGKLGRLSTGKGPVKIRKVADSRQANCIGKTVEGTIVNYTAGSTAGQDRVQLSRKRLGGNEARYDITISVK